MRRQNYLCRNCGTFSGWRPWCIDCVRMSVKTILVEVIAALVIALLTAAFR